MDPGIDSVTRTKFGHQMAPLAFVTKGLATLIASVKLQRSWVVGVLPDTRKCYNSDQIIGVNGY